MRLFSQLTGPAKLPVDIARTFAGERGDLPVYVAAGALAVAGVLDWPVAATVGIAYTAIRRWGPPHLFSREEAQLDDDLVDSDAANAGLIGSAPTRTDPTVRTDTTRAADEDSPGEVAEGITMQVSRERTTRTRARGSAAGTATASSPAARRRRTS